MLWAFSTSNPTLACGISTDQPDPPFYQNKFDRQTVSPVILFLWTGHPCLQYIDTVPPVPVLIALEVCGEARTFSETLDLATSLKPDVILLDLHMPDSESPESEFVKFKLLSTSSRIVAISLWQDEETKIIAQGYRAVRLLDKAKLCDELIPAIQRVSRQHS
jgi:CheY-like chemotaxis protein